MSRLLPLDINPTSISLASMMILGSRKQKAETKWMKEDVGPPWCQAFLMIPEDLARTDGGSREQVERL